MRPGVELLEDRTTPALVAAYSFGEGSGTTTADASGNGLTGTPSNATWTTTGKFGNAPQFTGATNSYVTVNSAASLNLTSVLSPSLVNTARASWNRHVFAIKYYALGYDPASLGFPSSLTSQCDCQRPSPPD